MDAFLHLLCLPLDGSVLHVASTVWTAIFLGQDPDKHRYLSEVCSMFTNKILIPKL